jgi:agmatinase
MTAFDPNAPARPESGIFGLPFGESDSRLVLVPVPWEATTSYGGGTSEGPRAILKASHQVDLFDLDVLRPFERGLCLLPERPSWRALGAEAKQLARRVIEHAGVVSEGDDLARVTARVNALGERLNDEVYDETRRLLAAGKIVGVVGGDHSTPLGAIRAAAETHRNMGVLQIDAHADLRCAYEGFTYSHASIMHNVLERIGLVKKLVQVGIRDVCDEEMAFTAAQGERLSVFYDRSLGVMRCEGVPFADTARRIVEALPQNVWITFDVDGLDPRYCPHTGTPVPGGLDFAEANYLLRTLVQSGRAIVGFDLCEVAPDTRPDARDEWDANVGARLLYKLCAWTLASRGEAQVRP